MSLLNKSTTMTSRRLKGRARRTRSVGTKLTEEEERIVLVAAEKDGKAPSEWTRDVLMAAAHSGVSSPESNLFVEVQALRLLLVNTLEPLLRGDTMTQEQFKAMLQYVKANKRKAASDMLASYAGGQE